MGHAPYESWAGPGRCGAKRGPTRADVGPDVGRVRADEGPDSSVPALVDRQLLEGVIPSIKVNIRRQLPFDRTRRMDELDDAVDGVLTDCRDLAKRDCRQRMTSCEWHTLAGQNGCIRMRRSGKSGWRGAVGVEIAINGARAVNRFASE